MINNRGITERITLPNDNDARKTEKLPIIDGNPTNETTKLPVLDLNIPREDSPNKEGLISENNHYVQIVKGIDKLQNKITNSGFYKLSQEENSAIKELSSLLRDTNNRLFTNEERSDLIKRINSLGTSLTSQRK